MRNIKGFSAVSEKEMLEVNAGGLGGGICAGITGGALSGFMETIDVIHDRLKGKEVSNKEAGERILDAYKKGFVGGFVLGALTPTP